MKVNFKKIFGIILIIFLVLGIYSLCFNVFASSSIGEKAINEFSTEVKNNSGDNTFDQEVNMINGVLGGVQVVGVGIGVIMLIVLGIKYMCSSVQEKADIKKHAVVYVTGAVLLFAASGIVGLIKLIAKDIK